MKTRTIKCNFKNAQGKLIDARLDVPKDFAVNDINSVKAYIIFCHCFTCTKETITTFRLSRLLAENGYAVLRFDFMGLGGSEGDFSDTTFSSTQDDLRSAINFLQDNYQPPSFLMGHSLGGTTVLSIASDFDFVRGIVTVASPCEPEHVLHHFGYALTLLEQGSVASFEVAGQYFDIKPAFVETVRNVDMKTRLSSLDKPVLIITIENDALVSEGDARQIEQWASGETRLISIKNSDHLLSDKAATEKVAQDIIQWLRAII